MPKYLNNLKHLKRIAIVAILSIWKLQIYRVILLNSNKFSAYYSVHVSPYMGNHLKISTRLSFEVFWIDFGL